MDIMLKKSLLHYIIVHNFYIRHYYELLLLLYNLEKKIVQFIRAPKIFSPLIMSTKILQKQNPFLTKLAIIVILLLFIDFLSFVFF